MLLRQGKIAPNETRSQSFLHRTLLTGYLSRGKPRRRARKTASFLLCILRNMRAFSVFPWCSVPVVDHLCWYVRPPSESYHISCAQLSSRLSPLSTERHLHPISDSRQLCLSPNPLTTTLWEGDGLSRRYSWNCYGSSYVTLPASAKCDITSKLSEFSDELKTHFYHLPEMDNILRLVSFLYPTIM